MTRVDTQTPPHGISIKQNPISAYLIRFILVAALTAFVIAAFCIYKRPVIPSDDSHFMVNNIPEIYAKLEGVDPEERELFHGFRTSFLPAEEVILARCRSKCKREVYEGNVTSDIFIWASEYENRAPTRLKRMSNFTFSTQDYIEENPLHNHRQRSKEQDEDSTEESENEYDSAQTSDQYEENEGIESMVRPQTHVDRGPLDDVVEQVHGQPELEEEEMDSSAHLYKPVKSHSGIQAFWKGQGDKDTIKTTQANIMRRNMDAEADPCHDFYQYACGNWAALNPIPADKAGYDTFEMLRENLDAVLKDLLEFKSFEDIPSIYPGPHLDIQHNLLNNINNRIDDDDKLYIETIETQSNGILNGTNEGKYHYDWNKPYEDKSEIFNLIQHFLNRKARSISKPSNGIITKVLHSKKIKSYEWKKGKPKRVKRPLQYYSRKKAKSILKSHVEKPKAISIRKKIHTFSAKHKNVLKRETYNTKDKNNEPRQMPMQTFDDLNLSTGNAAMKARFLFKSCMNYEILQKRGHQPLLDLLHLLGGWPILDPSWNDSNFDWLELMAKLRQYNNDILISEWVGPDIKNSDEFVIQFDQTSLGLPTREYFLQDSNKVYLTAYKNYLIKVALLLGGDPVYVKKSADQLIEFEINFPVNEIMRENWRKLVARERSDFFTNQIVQASPNNEIKSQIVGYISGFVGTWHLDDRLVFPIIMSRLAKITSAPEDRRNVSELYRRMTLQKLETLVPEIKWKRYLCVVMNRTVRSDETVVLFALNYVKHLIKLIGETDSSILSNYLLWRFVRHRVNNLDDRFQSAKQQFYFILFGREQAPPRWKNCISQVNSNMGMALGSMFVKKYFDETSKNDTLTMTREIQQSFRELLHKIDWIDDETKKLAAHKVDAMMLRIGYPDFILRRKELDERYKEVKIHPDKYFENILNILQHLTQMEQSRIGQPVNKTLWNTAPAVVNAYYSRNKNQIMFPAGILQPPFYHRHFPRSLNYGGIGVVIGHEITHGFDDKGRLFDCNGNLHRWWSDTAIESFHHRAQCLIDQYGQYVVPEVNMKLDGVNTQGENIADNGGVKQAFRAYTHWVQRHGTEGETLPGLNHTHTQLFFLNFAQVWCGAMRPEAMRNKLKTAVHSPGRFRVIGTLSNSHDFAREFRCPPGSPMNPTQKCTVW